MRRAHLGRIFEVKRIRSPVVAPRSRAFGFLHVHRSDPRLDRADRIMPVANHAPTTVGKNQLGVRGQECLELRLDRLGNQPSRAGP